MRNKILIFIAGLLLGLSIIFIDIKEEVNFDLIYVRDSVAVVARLGREERKAWSYQDNLIIDDRGWIWESNLNLKPEEVITIIVDGDEVVDYRK